MWSNLRERERLELDLPSVAEPTRTPSISTPCSTTTRRG
jgi:hypothetical protein